MEQQLLGSTPTTVVVASRYGTLWALDARDGSIRWRLTPTGRQPTLVHGGDVLYVSSHILLAAFRDLGHRKGSPIPRDRRPRVHACPADIAAIRISDGTTIWQQEGWSATSSAIALDGDLLLGEGPVQTIGDVHIHAFDAHTGAIRWAYDAGLRAGFQRRLLAARAGRVLVWREEVGARRLDVLYSARLTDPQERGEVTALDIHTGQLLWRWRTPGTLISLLRLWGRRIPQVLIYALAQARRAIIHARDSHDRGIIHREIIHGQWRRPTHLISYIGVHLAVHADVVYLATSMGLFALHARNGHLLWHVLPTSELTQVVASP